MTLETAHIQTKLLNNAVLLTGPPRSGTTLLGKLIGSFNGLEYHFEPPTLYMIASTFASGELPLDIAVRLLTVYLSEDLLLESVHGRGVNLRPGDDSQILNSMTWAELNNRWNSIANHNDAISLVQKNGLRLAVKMPNLFDSLELMQQVMQGMHLIVSVRNGADVVRSIIRKGWVNDEGLERNLWPYRGKPARVNTPYWVTEEYQDRWPVMNAENRACLMWTHHAELALAAVAKKESNERVHVVRYEELLTNANHVVDELAAALDCDTTIHTCRWVETICTPDSMHEGNNRDFVTNTDSDITEHFEYVNSQWGY